MITQHARVMKRRALQDSSKGYGTAKTAIDRAALQQRPLMNSVSLRID